MSAWLGLAGLGAFHGLNPAMGWLFAVALALHRGSRRTLWLALAPIAVGHAAAVLAAAAAAGALGLIVGARGLELAAGAVLIGWAGYLAARGHRHRVRVGLGTGLLGLGLWSFLMASAHGAGLMLVPAVLPLCLSGSPGAELTASGSLPVALAAVGVHMAAMLAVMAGAAALVYEWAGLGVLRRAWINLDLIWIGALAAAGLVLVL